MAKPVLDVVPLAVARFAGGAVVVPRVVLGTTGRYAALRAQKGTFAPPYKAEDDADNGWASDTRVGAEQVAFSVALVACVARLRGKAVVFGLLRTAALIAAVAQAVNAIAARLAYSRLPQQAVSSTVVARRAVVAVRAKIRHACAAKPEVCAVEGARAAALTAHGAAFEAFAECVVGQTAALAGGAIQAGRKSVGRGRAAGDVAEGEVGDAMGRAVA